MKIFDYESDWEACKNEIRISDTYIDVWQHWYFVADIIWYLITALVAVSGHHCKYIWYSTLDRNSIGVCCVDW